MKTPTRKISESSCRQIILEKLHTENFTILSYEEVSFDEINGYLGDHSLLKIQVQHDNGTQTFKFFIKALPHVESQKTFLLEFNGFFKEKQFFTKYQRLLTGQGIHILKNSIPECHYVNEELFIFEDLASRGYVTLPSRVPMPLDCIKSGLAALAKLHSSALILEELRGFRLNEDFAEELRESFYLGTDATENGLRSCKSGIRALIDLTHTEEMKISKKTFTEKALEGCELQKADTKPSTKFRNTLCHADLWTKNFMFKFEEGEAINCVLVDFQTYRYGPPAQDVMAFIYLVSDRQTRRLYLQDLLDFYYGKLKGNFDAFHLKDVVTEEEFFESCNYFKRYALTQNLLHFQVVILSEEIASELFSDQERAKKVLFDDKYDFFIETCRKDQIFKQRNFEVIEEMREFYEESLK